MREGRAKVWIVLVIIIIVLIAGVVAFNLFSKPRDLGVRYTVKDYESAVKKIQQVKDNPPQTGTRSDYIYKWSGKIYINQAFTQEEITAWFDYSTPSYTPFKDVQIKFNNDGTIEASAKVDFNALKYYLTEEEKKYIPSFIPVKAPVYCKGTLTVINNQVDINLEKVTVGAVPIPANLLTKENMSYVDNKVEALMKNVPNLYVESLRVENEKLIYKGTDSAKLTRIKKP